MSSEIQTTGGLVRQIRELILAARKTAAQTVVCLTYRDRLLKKCQMPSGKFAVKQKSQTLSD